MPKVDVQLFFSPWQQIIFNANVQKVLNTFIVVATASKSIQ